MVSKVLTGHSFYGTIRYICQQQKQAEILACEGVRAYDYRLMIQDFLLQKQLRPSKQQACFHGVLSFYPGENPDSEKMVAIAKEYLAEVGLTDTQYMVAKHADKKHLHLHIVANLVNNYGKSIQDNWIGYRGKKAAQRLTQVYGLTPALQKDLTQTNRQALHRSEAVKYDIYAAILESLPRCRTMEQLEVALLKAGIETQYKYKSGTTERQGVSFRKGDDCFKGSQVDRRFSLGHLEKTLALQRRQTLGEQVKETCSATVDRRKEKAQKQSLLPDFPAHHAKNIEGERRQKQTRQMSKAAEQLRKPEQTTGPSSLDGLHEAHPQKKKSQGLRH